MAGIQELVLRARPSRALRLGLWLAFLVAGLLSFAFSAGSLAQAGDEAAAGPRAIVLEVDGPIGPAVTHYLEKGFQAAREERAEIIVIELDTPGGLVETTRDIIDRILRSPIPVATYVSPSGSRAASAGTYIVYASHIAAMAPGTTMGAATPVQIGGDDGSPFGDEGENEEEAEEAEEAPGRSVGLQDKMLEDAVAYMRSLAELRGRNADWAERAVREAATVTDREAVEDNIVDVRARNIPDLLEQIDGRTVTIGEDEREVELATAGAEIERRPPDWVDELLAIITNPNIAFIFMMLGVYGLFFELANPGAMVPGVMGAISLLIALYALNVLPINHAGLGLLLLGVALMVGEAFVPSFGVLGIGGLAAFGLGSLMLFEIDDPAFQLSPWTVAGVTAMTGLILILLVGYLLRAQSRPIASGEAGLLVGRVGKVQEWAHGQGMILLDGEWWNAEGPEEVSVGELVRVDDVKGLLLTVSPIEATDSIQERRS